MILGMSFGLSMVLLSGTWKLTINGFRSLSTPKHSFISWLDIKNIALTTCAKLLKYWSFMGTAVLCSFCRITTIEDHEHLFFLCMWV